MFLIVWLDSPELFDGVGKADVMADDVEETAEGCYGDEVHKPKGNFGKNRTYYTGANVVYGDGFQTPATERLRFNKIKVGVGS